MKTTKAWLRRMSYAGLERKVLVELASGRTPEQVHAAVDEIAGRYAGEENIQAAAKRELSLLLEFEGTMR